MVEGVQFIISTAQLVVLVPAYLLQNLAGSAGPSKAGLLATVRHLPKEFGYEG